MQHTHQLSFVWTTAVLVDVCFALDLFPTDGHRRNKSSRCIANVL